MENVLVKVHEYKNQLSLKNKLSRFIWNIVCFLFFQTVPTKYGNFWRVFLLRVFGAKIGINCTVESTAKIWAPWNLEMKDNSLIAKKVNCYNIDKVIVFSESIISEGVFLCTASHNVTLSHNPLIHAPIIVKDQAWIAADVFIGMGVTIGQGAVVGARAAVFKDVDSWTIVGGNPAKFIKKRIIND